MTIRDFISKNYLLIYELIGLLIILVISAHVPSRMKKYTKVTCFLLIASAVVHALELWTQTIPYTTTLRALLTATKYSIYPLSLITFLSILSPIEKKNWKSRIAIIAPWAVCTILFFTSQWTGLVAHFSEGEDGISGYGGGPLGWLPYLLFGGYLVLFVIQNIYYLRKYKRRDRLTYIYIVLGAIGGFLVYFLVKKDDDDYTPIITTALILFYLFYYIHRANIDTLTGLMNRQSYYQDIHLGEASITATASIDMNDLKFINDNYGHEAGDEALISISNVLVNCKLYHSTVYRVGGDEFMILYYKVTEEKIKENIAMMKEELAKTDYSCAFGYAMRLPNEKLQATIKRSDDEMYIDKAMMKKERSN